MSDRTVIKDRRSRAAHLLDFLLLCLTSTRVVPHRLHRLNEPAPRSSVSGLNEPGLSGLRSAVRRSPLCSLRSPVESQPGSRRWSPESPAAHTNGTVSIETRSRWSLHRPGPTQSSQSCPLLRYTLLTDSCHAGDCYSS